MMSDWAALAFDEIVGVLGNAGDPARREPMAAYMKHHFVFLGIPAPVRESLTRAVFNGLAKPTADDVVAFAMAMWELPEREYQYVGTGLLHRYAMLLPPAALPELERLITTKSWWDTVDELAGHPVGSIVRRHPEQRAVMHTWLVSDNMWLARTAIIHQIHSRDDTDEAWLFNACATRATDTEFFIRKAIGWALRSYAHRGPAQADAVRAFIAEHESRLSGLSKREALRRVKH
jgi:3-methyladenine DNA glycosylase AlkD